MKKLKKYISILLAVLMVSVSMPFTAFADDKVDISGSDENVSWNYTASTDTLYINGEEILIGDYGALPTYKDGVYVQINFSHLVIGKDVKKLQKSETACVASSISRYKYQQGFDVAFEEGTELTEIGASAFRCSTVTAVIFPDSVEIIGARSFSSSSNLTSVSLPSKLKEIDKYAFNCCSLSEIKFPDSLTSIGDYCFYENNIQLLTFPDSLTSIGEKAFYNCSSLAEINFSKNAEKLSIGSYAFRGAAITELTIPAYIDTLNSDVFSGCINLASVDFEVRETESGLQGLTTLYNAFPSTAITSITLPETLTQVKLGALGDMKQLQSADLSKTQVTSFGSNSYLFQRDNLLTDVKLPAKLTDLGEYTFWLCTSLESIELPDTLTTIGDYAFYGCSLLNSIDLPDAMNYIGDYAFYNCSSLTSVIIPDSVTVVSPYAFSNCSSLEYVKMPNEMGLISTVYWGAYKNCRNLKTVVLPSDLSAIGKEAFYNCTSLVNINIPDTVTKIGEQAFYKCPADFDLPKKLTSVGSKAFEDSGLTRAVFESPVVLDNYAFYGASKLTQVVLPEEYGKTYLEEYTFYDCDMLESVTISANIKTIQESAFEFCGRLKTVTIPEDSQLMTIGTKAFEYCYDLSSIKLPSTVSSIGTYAFYKCSSLNNVNLQDTQLTEIYDYAFGCTALGNVQFPETLTGFRTGAFYNSQITKLELSEKISGAKSDVFKNCPITEVTVYNPNFNFYDNTFSGENTTIKGYRGSTAALFAGENNMTFIALESGDTETPVIPGDPDTAVPTSGTFDGGTWIVTGGNELVISGEGDITTSTAYDNDGNEYTFAKIAGLNNVKAVIVCYGITSLPEKFLYGTKFLTESSMTVTLPDTLIAIGNNAFRYTNLTYIDIPDSVTSIGEYAFYEAGLANGVKLSNSLTAINQYVFANNDFSSIGIPNSVTDIELAAFNNCNSLVNMYIPETVTTINEGASTTKPVGFTSSGDKLEDFTIECSLNSRAYQYAVTNGINTKLDMESGYASGYYSTRSCAKWYYYPDTKEFYFVSNGVQPSDNTFYHSDGTAITDGELDIDSLIVCYGVTDFSGINGESIFKVLNPKTITLPETVVSIGDNAFSGLTKLKSTKIPDNATTLSATAFNNCNIEAISFGNGIKTIPDYMFKDNKTLKYIDFGSVHTIGKGAFQSCTALEEIDIPYFTRTVGESAFEKCLSVKSVTIEYGYPLTVGEKAFADLPLCDTVEFNRTTVHYTDGTDESIFRNLGSGTTGIYLSVGDESDQLNHSTDLSLFIKKNIVELNIGESITKINNAESFPYLKNISVDDANETFFSYGGCLYDRSNEDGNIILIMAPSNLKEVEIYEGTRWIWPYAFYESKIEHIEIPEGVTLIGDYAFYGCTELRKVTFPSTLEGIYNNAFENCTKLKIIDLPSVIYICNSAFKNCTSLASIILPDNLMSIDPCAFAGCTSLTGLVMPNNESYLCSIVFENCTSLKDVYMWNNDFAPDTFIGCDNVVIHTLVGTYSYALAKEYGLNCVAYTDENIFADECAMMEDIYEGYIGFCGDGHGDIQYLTVYEPTCEQDGYIIGVCEYCSVILEEIHIEATGHKYERTVAIDPTETTVGVEKFTCAACGESYSVYSPALGGDISEKTLCNITGTAVIANSKTADTGVTPLKSVSVKLGDETLATTDSNGNFSFSLETGVYELTLWYNYGFERAVYLVVEDKDVDIGTVPLVACDWNKDGRIDDGDMELFKFVISSKVGDPAYLDYVDMNNDGKIDVKDLVYMNYVKGLDREAFTYPAIVAEAKI